MLKQVTNVSQVIKISLFRYPGGKTWLVPITTKWLRYYRNLNLLVEPFAGGGSVGLAAAQNNLVERVLLVELDDGVASVWLSALNGQSEWLCRKIQAFDFSEDNVRAVLSRHPRSLKGRAFKTIIHNRASRSGIMAEGAGLIKKGENGRGIASRWYPETLEKRIRTINGLAEKIGFVHGNGLAVIEEYLGRPDAALFIDPPYTIAGQRLYRHNEVDHERLFSLASRHEGPCLLTYDDSPDVRRWVRRYGFGFRRVAMQSAHLSRKKELLICRDFRWLR